MMTSSKKEGSQKSDDSIERNHDEEEEEFMIVMHACKERKKFEEDINRPGIKNKLSQTGWKIRHNFIKKSNIHLDDKDRIDVFGGGKVEWRWKKQQ